MEVVHRQVLIVLFPVTDAVIEVPDVLRSGSVKLEFPDASLPTDIAWIIVVTGALPSDMAMHSFRRPGVVVVKLSVPLLSVGTVNEDRADNVTLFDRPDF